MKAKFKNPRARHDFQGRPCSITGVGSYVPEKILTNAELEKMVETSDEWITSRTGIQERRWVSEATATSDLALEATRRALAAAGLDNKSVQFIGTGVWDVPNVGSDTMARGALYAAPDPARRAD